MVYTKMVHTNRFRGFPNWFYYDTKKYLGLEITRIVYLIIDTMKLFVNLVLGAILKNSEFFTLLL